MCLPLSHVDGEWGGGSPEGDGTLGRGWMGGRQTGSITSALAQPDVLGIFRGKGLAQGWLGR